MNISLISDFSFWWIIMVTCLSVALSWLFYFYQSKYSELSRTKLILLFILRFSAMWIVGFLLLNPIVKSVIKKEVKPTIVIAHDNSSSIISSSDSVFIKTEYRAKFEQLVNSLEAKYKVETLSFGSEIADGIDFNFNDNLTNFIPLFQELNTKFYNKAIGALVIATDGIYNRGINPEKLISNIKAPIYTIALGDTSINQDIKIDRIEYNSDVFKGNKTPVFAFISANHLKNSNTLLTVKKGDSIVATQAIGINDNDYFKKFTFELNADEIGLNRFDFVISEIEGERILENNTKSAFINVSETKRKILLIQHGWHPDIGTINLALKNNEAFELKIVSAKENIGNISEYDLLILHQLPSVKHSVSQVVRQVVEQNKPVLFIVGQQSSIKALNQCNLGVVINNYKGLNDNTNIGLNNQFSLYTLEYEESIIKQFPPLTVPFADFPPGNACNILFYQSVGSILTVKPLIYFPETGSQKVGIICGEGIWRWALAEYSYSQSHRISYEIIQKSVQYLLTHSKKERFIVDVPNIVDEGQQLNIQAKIFNPSFELINDSDISFSLFDELGNEYPYYFEKDRFDYKLKINNLSIGKYYYKASTTIANDQFVKKGSFFVHEMQVEDYNLTANHNLLYRISNESGGKMFLPVNFANIGTEIVNNPDIKSIIYPMKEINELIDKKYLFILIILFVTIEWFLRKIWGFH